MVISILNNCYSKEWKKFDNRKKVVKENTNYSLQKLYSDFLSTVFLQFLWNLSSRKCYQLLLLYK